MKKIVLIVTVMFLGLTVANAQTKVKTKRVKKAKKEVVSVVKATPQVVKTELKKVSGPSIVFENETIDYGTIPHNADGKREFVFVNNGTEPLIIETAQGSCGCTVPTKPEKPIAPGEKGVIGVKYDTNREGTFTKNVTIKSNASETAKILTIKGTVSPKPIVTPEVGLPIKS